MARISRTWWGERFLEALEQCTDYGRLSRGRSYSRPGRMLSFSIEGAHINARLRGNINPYFGVYKEPRYTVEIQLKAIAAKKWKQILKRLAGNAGWLSRLLMNEMPDDIEDAFRDSGVSLLPASPADLKTALPPTAKGPALLRLDIGFIVSKEKKELSRKHEKLKTRKGSLWMDAPT